MAVYALAAGSAVCAAGLHWVLTQVSSERAPYLFAICAVMISALWGGRGPGLLCALAGAALGAAYYWMSGAFTPAHVFDTCVYLLLGVGVALYGDVFWRSNTAGAEIAEHLREREAHLQSILDTVPDAMIIIDDHGRIRSFSPAAERTFGWSAAEIRGRNVSLLMPSPDREAHDGYLSAYLRTGQAKVIGLGRTVRGQRKDGEIFPMELSVAETGSSSGRFFTGFVRDLSDRFAAENRMRELQGEILHMSRLTAMGEMAATLAHELNQPLSAAANFFGAARKLLGTERFDPARANVLLDKAGDQILRAGQIIRRLREFVARGENEQQIESLVQLMKEACALALVGVEEAGIAVRTRFAPEVDLVLVDKIQVQQVVLNLLRNAVDAMRGEDVRELTVAVAAQGEEALIQVSDTGPGISAEVADKLFQPFMTTKSEGMGVGLSISKTIIEAHGGRIWAENNARGGATFNFTLPRVGLEALK